VLAFIQSIIVYKFPNLSPKEIAAMMKLNDDIKKTVYYQTIMKETKLDFIPKLIQKGLSIQEIAELLELNVEEVRKVAEKV
jgi:predicted transposase YdaD